MKDLITEARELCKYSEKIINQLHTERLDYELEYMPLIETIQVTSELCDALEKATAKNDELIRELSELARESVKRGVVLAKLEAEVRASLHEAQERDKGCDHCNLIYKLDGASYGTTDEIIDNKFCPMCGKRLEEHREAD